ncbi:MULTISPECIES: hypothetical protein [Helicobacter]|uniref:hypothetical protein n=1 Tax=Helicobacter TaxID=209 RepID=UPI0011DC8E62|nr:MULTISPECIES: hypothetical protein [Helicobacter]
MGEVSINMESQKILNEIFRLFSKVQNDRYRDFSLTLKMTKKSLKTTMYFIILTLPLVILIL